MTRKFTRPASRLRAVVIETWEPDAQSEGDHVVHCSRSPSLCASGSLNSDRSRYKKLAAKESLPVTSLLQPRRGSVADAQARLDLFEDLRTDARHPAKIADVDERPLCPLVDDALSQFGADAGQRV